MIQATLVQRKVTMGHSGFKLNLHLGKKAKSFSTARKSITLKSVKLPSLVGKCCRILQYFATKLGSFTNFKMLFVAVVTDFVLFTKMRSQFKREWSIPCF